MPWCLRYNSRRPCGCQTSHTISGENTCGRAYRVVIGWRRGWCVAKIDPSNFPAFTPLVVIALPDPCDELGYSGGANSSLQVDADSKLLFCSACADAVKVFVCRLQTYAVSHSGCLSHTSTIDTRRLQALSVLRSLIDGCLNLNTDSNCQSISSRAEPIIPKSLCGFDVSAEPVWCMNRSSGVLDSTFCF